MKPGEVTLIVGAGSGLSASLAKLFARDTAKLAPLAAETGALPIACDATDAAQVEAMFGAVEARWGVPDLVVYNAGYRARGPFVELDPLEVERSIRVSAFGGFLAAQAAARRIRPAPAGAIFFTGASASVKGYAESAPFAMGKFALRGLAQSMARELAPRGIHVGHFVIDGRIQKGDDSTLDPDEIARTYLYAY